MFRILKKNPKYYYTDKLSLLIGIHICIVKAQQLCDSASKLMGDDKDLTHAYGLYTFAIEEFGKALYLQEFFINDDNVIQKFRKNIFSGQTSHTLKFKKGLKNLPKECKITRVYSVAPFPSGKEYTTNFGRGNLKFKFLSNTRTSLLARSTPNFAMRMNSFYVDWNDKQKRWDFNFKVEKNDLKKAVSKFKKHIPKYDLVMQKKKQEKIK